MTRPPLVVVPQHFGSTVFDRRTSRYLPFDREATTLLLATRDRPFDAAIAHAPPADRGPRAAFFEHFAERGFFTLDRRLAGVALDVAPPADHLLGPLAVHLEVVAACNLTCTHCFAGELPRREAALTLPELDRLFEQLAALGSFRLGLTGGEPLLRRDLLDVLDRAVDRGLMPCFTTNGHFVTDELADALATRELAWLNVSLDGATPKTNDLVRGPGSFERALAGLETLARRGARFTLAFTILKTNLHEVTACARLAARLGAHCAVFRPLYPVGTARSHPELLPTYDEYARALEELAALDVEGLAVELGDADDDPVEVDLHTIDAFSPTARREARAVVHENIGCGAANLVASISVSGEVSPCSFLGAAFAAANVRDTPFGEIWSRSQTFRAMRGLPGDPAGTSAFGGGCRARSLNLAGDVNAPDPWLAASERTGGAHPLSIVERGPR